MRDPVRDALVGAGRALLVLGASLGVALWGALWWAGGRDVGQGSFVRLWASVALGVFLMVLAGQWMRLRPLRRIGASSVRIEEVRIDPDMVRHAQELRSTGLPWDAVCTIVEPRWPEWPEPPRAEFRARLERATR